MIWCRLVYRLTGSTVTARNESVVVLRVGSMRTMDGAFRVTSLSLFALAACTGLRLCELIRLPVDDLDVCSGCETEAQVNQIEQCF